MLTYSGRFVSILPVKAKHLKVGDIVCWSDGQTEVITYAERHENFVMLKFDMMLPGDTPIPFLSNEVLIRIRER